MTRPRTPPAPSARLSDGPTPLFLFCWVIANAGAYIAFVPLISLILPLKVAVLAPISKVSVLSQLLLVGAVAASLANILAGAVSDRALKRWNTRFPVIATGLLLTPMSFWLINAATTSTQLIAAVIVFQLCFNLMFAPLIVLLADHIPDAQKASIAALLNLGLPAGTAFIALLTIPNIQVEGQRFIIIDIAILVCVAPLLLAGRHQPLLLADIPKVSAHADTHIHDFAFAWVARMMVQVAGSTIFNFLFYYLQDIVQYAEKFPHHSVESGLGQLSALASVLTIIISLVGGHLSDLKQKRLPFLKGSSLAVGTALIMMALWPVWPVALAGYILFIAALTTFLTVDAALVAQLVAKSGNRARLLGIMNLTNTVPTILVSAMAYFLAAGHFDGAGLRNLMVLGGVLSLAAPLLLSRIRTII
jgi:MFS family permease